MLYSDEFTEFPSTLSTQQRRVLMHSLDWANVFTIRTKRDSWFKFTDIKLLIHVDLFRSEFFCEHTQNELEIYIQFYWVLNVCALYISIIVYLICRLKVKKWRNGRNANKTTQPLAIFNNEIESWNLRFNENLFIVHQDGFK